MRAAIREIGYVNKDDVFHADQRLHQQLPDQAQSPDIAQGVDAKKAKGKKTAEQGAGDQGLMFGYACNETPELMPTPVMFAHRLGRKLTQIRKSRARSTGSVPMRNPRYPSATRTTVPVSVENVVISTQHTADVAARRRSRSYLIENVIKKVIPARMLNEEDRVSHQPDRPLRHRWPAGRFRSHRPQDHRGHLRRLGPSRRRRLLRQGSVQGGPLGGLHGPLGREEHRGRRTRRHRRDPVRLRHRPSRARERLRRHFSGTGKPVLSDEADRQGRHQGVQLQARRHHQASSTCSAPSIAQTTNYGHFGKTAGLPWEQTNKAAALKRRGQITSAHLSNAAYRMAKAKSDNAAHQATARPISTSRTSPWLTGAARTISVAEHEMPGLVSVRKKYGPRPSRSRACASPAPCT